MTDANVEYYNKNADSFFEGSISADMSSVRNRFVNYLPKGAHVLDAGCGSGRDSKAFLDLGYDVTAFDASKEMCIRASEYIKRDVINMRFEDISYDNEFDGIWACASLLHVPMDNLPEVMHKMNKALKKDGIMYASFKRGDGTKRRGERVFSDYNKESIIQVYPNPTKDKVFIKTHNEEIDRIILVNSLGKTLKEYNKSTSTINLSSFNKGIYYAIFYTKSNRRIVKKIIIE